MNQEYLKSRGFALEMIKLFDLINFQTQHGPGSQLI